MREKYAKVVAPDSRQRRRRLERQIQIYDPNESFPRRECLRSSSMFSAGEMQTQLWSR